MSEMLPYAEFIRSKAIVQPTLCATRDPVFTGRMFPFQEHITRRALEVGRFAIFADCGLGKTLMQLEWAANVPDRVLIVTPLAVAEQTVVEAAKFGIDGVGYARAFSPDLPPITVCNYEMIDHMEVTPEHYSGIIVDESSILKSLDGKFRQRLTELAQAIPYRLACTATPAPNDHMELGQHAEFLGCLRHVEMLSTFFVHDGGTTQKWRLKGHARDDFWRWVASWSTFVRKPSDIGFSDDGYDLPQLVTHEHVAQLDVARAGEGMLFRLEARTLSERRAERRASIADRVAIAAGLANASDEPWVLWCGLNDEGDALVKAIPDAEQVKGADSREKKTETLLAFARGDLRVLVTKPRIAGFGMNWQHCARIGFVGLSDSWEQFYQATRRCWRFGQERDVHVHIITASTEAEVIRNVRRKEGEAAQMADELTKNMQKATKLVDDRRPLSCEEGDGWTMYHGDCVEAIDDLDDGTVGLSVFSPPFASLYTYSRDERDMGNCRGVEEFSNHFRYLVPELLRVTMPGRLCCIHCMALPSSKQHNGFIGLQDFPGELVRLMSECGWIYHSQVCIWKDPVTAMQRTKALGLLHKQLKKDSTMSRQGLPDFVYTFRKPGTNPNPVKHTNQSFPVERWQEWASPIWSDIKPSDTLQHRSAREHADERHICPLQLEVIRRCVRLWSNTGDVVLSPYAGIGSEGYVALQEGRGFVGMELKASYHRQAVKNLKAALEEQGRLFKLET